jgi:TrmH family RNA methyltransferase
LNNIQIVLVRAENPANIGQVARAMKNFGLKELRLVNCVPHQVQEAYTLGWHGKEILDQARCFGSLNEAVKDAVYVVGFTRRTGHHRGEPRSLVDALPQVLEAAEEQSVALVFGNERNGLSNEELRLCHEPLLLPANPEYPSLNLAHAVAIAAFLLFQKSGEAEALVKKPERYYATQEESEDLMSLFRELLEGLDYKDEGEDDLLTRTSHHLRRLFQKAGLERREYHLFRAFLSRIEQKLGKNGHSGDGKGDPAGRPYVCGSE